MSPNPIVPARRRAIVAARTAEARLAEYQEKARGALSPNTERALRADTGVFSAWCAARDLEAFPASPETLAAFIDDQAATKSTATVRRYVASIAHMHRAGGLEDPTKHDTARLALKRVARTKGTRQRQAAPINYERRCRMIQAVGNRLIDKRDKALLAVTYDLMARRSELVALDVADIDLEHDGSATALIQRAKGDQEGLGNVCYLAPDTVVLLTDWVEAAGIQTRALFRSVTKGGKVGQRLHDRDVPRILKRMAKAAALEEDVSGHSCRVGVTQDMLAAGFGVAEIMQAGRWKSPTMPARYGEHIQARRGAVAKLAALQNRA